MTDAYLINDRNYRRRSAPPKGHQKGLKPRNYHAHPPGYLAVAQVFPDELLIPETEWAARLDEQQQTKSSLFDLREAEYDLLQSLDQDGYGYCLRTGTLVRLADGTDKPIETFTGGEQVVTHTGGTQKVLRPTSREYTGQVCTLRVRGAGRSITATADHRFLSPSGQWVPLGDCREVVFRGETARVGDYWPVRSHAENEMVYCLDVEEDHSFIAEGFAVHNCWAFSTTKSTMYTRAKENAPRERLSGWMVASIIKNYRDEGGWCQESLDFVTRNGIASLLEWPQKQVKKALDTPDMRASAAKRKVTEWWDGTQSRDKNRRIMISAFLMGFSPMLDFNWWSHSVSGCRLVKLNPLIIDIDNSWTPESGVKGIYTLEGDKAVPDNIAVPRVALPR